jgi:hypothetical protein
MSTRSAIYPATIVLEVAADYPGCSEVFRPHRESADRPTRFGHLEPLDRFARHRGIARGAHLSELAEASGAGVAATTALPTMLTYERRDR